MLMSYRSAKAIWDFEGIYCTSRHIPHVKFPGLIHPGILGCAPSAEVSFALIVLNCWEPFWVRVVRDSWTLGGAMLRRQRPFLEVCLDA